MKPYELKYICGPIAKSFHKDHTSRAKLLIGPVGTGKTTSCLYDKIICESKRVKRNKDGIRRSRYAIIRNTHGQLIETTQKTLFEWFPPAIFGLGGEKGWNQSKRTYTIAIEDRVIELLFKALDIEKDARSLLSLEITAAHIDESREVKDSIIKDVMSRFKRFPPKKDYPWAADDPTFSPFHTTPQLCMSTNYPSSRHALYRDFVSYPVDGYKIYEQDQKENSHNLPPSYYEDLEKDYANRPDKLRTLVRGEWGVVTIGKAVYSIDGNLQFNRKVHVAQSSLLPPAQEGARNGRTIFRGWDNTGLSPACVITYINTMGQWFIIKEFCGKDVTITDFGEEVILWCNSNFPAMVTYRDIGDPGGRIRDTIKKSAHQYMAEELDLVVEDGIQTFKIRVDSVMNRLNKIVSGEPALVVDPSCTMVIDGFEGGYAYPEIGSSGVFKTEPAKNEYSHPHDAIQYPATRIFNNSPEEYYRGEQSNPEGRNKRGGY